MAAACCANNKLKKQDKECSVHIGFEIKARNMYKFGARSKQQRLAARIGGKFL